MVSKAQLKANMIYKSKHIKKVALEFNSSNSKDVMIYSFLKAHPNKTKYIKDLIFENMIQRTCNLKKVNEFESIEDYIEYLKENL